jgi:RNA polymerase sigma-70 factor (ECF subfamily)
LQFENFDNSYLQRLRAGDFRTQEHFVKYFSELMQLKLRSRLSSAHAIEDVRQETFVRVFAALNSEGGVRQPERLGAFVNSICNHVLMEQYRSSSRDLPLENEEKEDPPDRSIAVLDIVIMKEQQNTVREILEKLPEKDRRILTAIFIEEEDKDKVCQDFNVSRDYLRVLLHRAKQEFKSIYLKSLEASAGVGGGR